MINDEKCAYCFYYGACAETEVCEDFDPIFEEVENMYMEEQMHQDQAEFYTEWSKYIREN